MPPIKVKVGDVYRRLVVIRRAANLGGRVAWECLCSIDHGGCGRTTVVVSASLTLGLTSSCGCLRDELLLERATKHGATRGGKNSPEYNSWRSILRRCFNPEDPAYENYGGRGITICDHWKGEHGFEHFLEDMGPRPSPRHTIDRYPDNDGNYEPGNCRWATSKQQARNRRSNHLVTIDGVTRLLCEWLEQYHLNRRSYRCRLYRGMSVEEAITSPKRPGRRRRNLTWNASQVDTSQG